MRWCALCRWLNPNNQHILDSKLCGGSILLSKCWSLNFTTSAYNFTSRWSRMCSLHSSCSSAAFPPFQAAVLKFLAPGWVTPYSLRAQGTSVISNGHGEAQAGHTEWLFCFVPIDGTQDHSWSTGVHFSYNVLVLPCRQEVLTEC